jgi:hypothetical protein
VSSELVGDRHGAQDLCSSGRKVFLERRLELDDKLLGVTWALCVVVANVKELDQASNCVEIKKFGDDGAGGRFLITRKLVR